MKDDLTKLDKSIPNQKTEQKAGLKQTNKTDKSGLARPQGGVAGQTTGKDKWSK